MGELKIIIWVILGIIYLVSRARKKKEAEAQEAPNQEPYTENKPVTFEELLREIQQTKTPKAQPQPILEPVKEYKTVDYDDDLKEEEQPLENTNYDYRKQDTIYETYEKARQEAFLRPSMEETLKLENTVVRFGSFKGYEQEAKPTLASIYAKELRDPTNFRKAFIMSEILNRRF
jgi:hypothetical protein